MFVKEIQSSPVTSLILFTDFWILKVRPGGHPSVNLRRKGFYIVRHFQILLVCFNSVYRFILGRQYCHWCCHLLRVIGIQQCRMALHGRLEHNVVLTCCETRDLGSPAAADNCPLCEATSIGCQLARICDNSGDFGEHCRDIRLCFKEFGKRLPLLVRVCWYPGYVARVILEEVRYKHSILALGVRCGEDVGSLQSLWEITEDICMEKDVPLVWMEILTAMMGRYWQRQLTKDIKDSLRGRIWTCYVCRFRQAIIYTLWQQLDREHLSLQESKVNIHVFRPPTVL